MVEKSTPATPSPKATAAKPVVAVTKSGKPLASFGDPLQRAMAELMVVVEPRESEKAHVKADLEQLQKKHAGHPEVYIDPKFVRDNTETLAMRNLNDWANISAAQKYVFLRRAEDYARAWQETDKDPEPLKTPAAIKKYCVDQFTEGYNKAAGWMADRDRELNRQWDTWSKDSYWKPAVHGLVQTLIVPTVVAATRLPTADDIFWHSAPATPDVKKNPQPSSMTPLKKEHQL